MESVSASVHAGIHTQPWADTTPQAHTPPGQTPPTATAADGTHPTGMLSCSNIV